MLALSGAPAAAQTLGDTSTVTLGPVSGYSILTCHGHTDWVTCEDEEPEFLDGNATIEWSAPVGWRIVGTPTSTISGSNASFSQPIRRIAGADTVMTQHDVRRAYALALKLAQLGAKREAFDALTAERDKLLATFGPDADGDNSLLVAGTCSGDCTVTVSATVNLIYVGPNDPFALLVSLVRRFKL
jgi:hypothetical protein